MRTPLLNRDSPDDCRSAMSVFWPLLQDGRELRTATDTSGIQNGGRVANLAIFRWHLDALLPSIACERMTIAPHAGALVAAAAVVPQSAAKSFGTICRGMATSAIWKAT
jgi:hypothetical protein